jgi:hypothetical protein
LSNSIFKQFNMNFALCACLQKQNRYANLRPLYPGSGRESAGWQTAPAGGENPTGFHPFLKPIPVLAGNQRLAECPCRGRKRRAFSSLCETYPLLKPIPDSIRESAGWQAEYRHAAAVLTRWVRNAAA